MRRAIGMILGVAFCAGVASGQATNSVRYRLGLGGTYTPPPPMMCPPDCTPVSGTPYIHGSETNGQESDPATTPVVRWDAICIVEGPNQGAANLVVNLDVRSGSTTGPVAIAATFSGDDSTGPGPTNFSYGVKAHAALPDFVGRIIDPRFFGGPNMAQLSYGTLTPGEILGAGAGYQSWPGASQNRAGVGRLTLPDGSAGLGQIPVFDGRINVAGLAPGTYFLVLTQGEGVNVLKAGLNLNLPQNSFALPADLKPSTSISFVIPGSGGGGGGGGGGGTPPADSDVDGVPDDQDACPGFDDNDDADGDAIADGCDNCFQVANPDQANTDGDGLGNACDLCAGTDDLQDADGDGVPDPCDNCLTTPNANQADADNDSVGDVCDVCPGGDDSADSDGDGRIDACDNCPNASNFNQSDADGDGVGDACDVPEPPTTDPPDDGDPPDGGTNPPPDDGNDGGSGDGSTGCGAGVAPGILMAAPALLFISRRRRGSP